MSTKITPEVTYNAVLGHVIQRHRDRLGFSQQQIASVLGISQSGYSKVELGGTTTSVLQLRTIAITLGMDPGALMLEAEALIRHLNAQGVVVVQSKDMTKAAAIAGLGMLAAVLAIAASST